MGAQPRISFWWGTARGLSASAESGNPLPHVPHFLHVKVAENKTFRDFSEYGRSWHPKAWSCDLERLARIWGLAFGDALGGKVELK